MAISKNSQKALEAASSAIKESKRAKFGEVSSNKAEIDLFKNSEASAYKSAAARSPEIPNQAAYNTSNARGWVPGSSNQLPAIRQAEASMGSEISPRMNTDYAEYGQAPYRANSVRGTAQGLVNNAIPLALAYGVEKAGEIQGLNPDEDEIMSNIRAEQKNPAQPANEEALGIRGTQVPYRPNEEEADLNNGIISAANNIVANNAPSVEDMSVSEQVKVAEDVNKYKSNPDIPVDPNSGESDLDRAKKVLAGMGGADAAPKTASQSFMDALTYFAPTIIGGIGGALIGGAEAGYGSAKAASSLNKEYRDFQEKQNKDSGLTAKDRTKALIHIMDQQAISKRSDEKLTQTKDLRTIQHQNADTSEGRAEFTKTKWGQQYPLLKEKHTIALQKIAELDTGTAKVFADLSAQNEQVKDLNKEFASPEIQKLIGPATGRFKTMAAALGSPDVKFVRLKGLTQNLTVQRVHDLFGSRVTDTELKQLDGALPNINSTPAQYMAQLKVFQDTVRNTVKGRTSSLRATNPMKGDSLDRIDELFDISNKPTKEQIAAERAKRGI